MAESWKYTNKATLKQMCELDFRRKGYDEMLSWKRELAGKTALLIEGARRVGKTHLIRRFVENVEW